MSKRTKLPKNDQIRRFEQAFQAAINYASANRRPAGLILSKAQLYEEYPGLNQDGMFMMFPECERGKGGLVLGVLADSIEALSPDDLRDRILDEVDDAILEGDLPSDPADFLA